MAAVSLIVALAALIVALGAWAALAWLAAKANALAQAMPPDTLRASQAADRLTGTPDPAIEANADRRVISGRIVPYDVDGDTSGGTYRVDPGALALPDDLSRVKLLLGHDRERPVGYLLSCSEASDGLYGQFAIAPGDDGDAAIAAVRHHIRDGLSYEVSRVRYSGDRSRVVAARLDAVALCSVPAYDDARAIAASRKGNDDMLTLEKARAILADADASAADQAAAIGYLLNHDEATDADRQAASDARGDADPAPADETAAADDPAPAETVAVSAARAPLGIGTLNATRRPGLTATQATHHIAQVARGANDAGQINAALADIVPAFDTGQGFVGRGQWLDELWTANRLQRDFIDAFMRAELTGFRVYGWRWVNKPEVGPWAGNKTEIPTNNVKTEPAEAKARYLAGGWDVGRELIDLGDPGLLSTLLSAAAQDYSRKSENQFAQDILNGATTAPDKPADLLEALDVAARALSMRGANLSTIAMSSDLWSEYLGMSAADAPWWLARQASVNLRDVATDVAGIRVFCNHTLPAGTVIAADRRAATYYEASPAPIRVQALNVPKGGIDIAVFGYNAAIINDPNAILRVNVGTAPAEATAAK